MPSAHSKYIITQSTPCTGSEHSMIPEFFTRTHRFRLSKLAVS